MKIAGYPLIAAVAACVALSACETMTETVPGGPHAPSIPSTALELGDYHAGAPDSVLASFQDTVGHRYLEGLALESVSSDLRHYQFNCEPNHDTRGDPPAQICRRTVTEQGCTYTWQVHLFDHHGDAVLSHARGLYDRRCGGDGLLGGPS